MSYRYGKTKISGFVKNIRAKEVVLTSAKSSGPGGQHVNKNETKVQLTRDIQNSTILPSIYVQKIIERNSQYVTKEGSIRIDTSVHRTQKANKDQTFKKLKKLIESGFKEKVERKLTKPPKHAVDKRIAEKRRRSVSRKLRTKIVG